jgi:hypothetical protein
MVVSWADLKAGEPVSVSDYFPFHREVAGQDGEDVLFGIIGEEADESGDRP